MRRTPTVSRAAAAALVAFAALVAALVLGAGPAAAETPAPDGPRVHHVLPENGAVLRASPDHVEVMFDVELVPGRVVVGLAPDDTGTLVALPAPVLDGPLLVQPLPPLPAGRYTVGVQLLDDRGQVTRGTFGFAVDPATPTAAVPGTDGTGTPWRGLVPLIGAVLLLPAAGLALRRRRNRTRTTPARAELTPPPLATAAAPAGRGRAAGRTPTSTSSPAGRRDR